MPAAQESNDTSQTVPNVELLPEPAPAAPASSSAAPTPRISFLITPPASRQRTPPPRAQQPVAPLSRERPRPTPPSLPRSLARAVATHYVPRASRARICSHGHITRTAESCGGCASNLGPFGWLYRCGMCGHKACGECGVHGRGWEGLVAIVELLRKRARGG